MNSARRGGETAVWAFLAFLTAAPAPAQTDVDFRAAAAYAVAAEPNSMALRDLDDDGHLDVAAAAFRANAVSILLGDGTGALQRVDDAVAIGSSLGIAAGRFDADTLPDLIVSQRESDNIWFLRNSGNGSFAAPALIRAGHDPWPLVAVDFNRDGMLDVLQALAPEVGGRVNVLYGNGNGTFDAAVGTSTGGGNSALDVADFNDDGRLDAIATNLGRASVSVVLGREDGTLAPHLESAVGDEPSGIATADLDGDGILDIAVSSTIGDAVTVSRGIGDGRFQPAQSHPVGDAPVAVALADIDGDGHLDLVVGNRGDGTLSLLLGDGTGDFGPPRSFIADRAPFALAVGDLNEDSVPDVVSVNGGEIRDSVFLSTATVFLGNGTTLDGIEQLASPAEATALAVADIDDDALPDIVVTLPDADLLAVHSRSAGRFSSTTIALLDEPTAVALADLDGDERTDIIAALQGTSDLAILMNRGGVFADVVLVSAGGEAAAIAAADYNNDGAVDVVAALAARDAVAFLRGDGEGGFAAPAETGLSGRPRAVASGDFDSVAGADLAVGLATGALAILHGVPGGLEAAGDVILGASPVALTALDADRDAFDDLAVAYASGTLHLLIGDGNGFSPPVPVGAVEMPSSITARDVTGDARADLLVSERLRDTVAVLAANGTGGFAAPVRFRVGDVPRAVRSGDFDGDGGYDFATACVDPSIAINRRSGAQRGDANGDGTLAAADLVAIVRAVRGARCVAVERYALSATDADGDGVVCRQDLRAGVLRIFGAAGSVEPGTIDG